MNLAVTSFGKNLVHYKRYRTQPRGAQTTLSSKSVLRKYLIRVGAVLISEQPANLVPDSGLVPVGSPPHSDSRPIGDVQNPVAGRDRAAGRISGPPNGHGAAKRPVAGRFGR